MFVGARVTEGIASLTIEGRVQFASESLASSAAGAPAGTTVSASLLGASLNGCLHYKGVGACAVPLVGSLRGNASLARATPQSSIFGGLGLRVTYAYALSKLFSLGAFLEGLAVLTPTQFVFQKGVAWEAGPIGGTAGAMLGVHLP